MKNVCAASNTQSTDTELVKLCALNFTAYNQSVFLFQDVLQIKYISICADFENSAYNSYIYIY